MRICQSLASLRPHLSPAIEGCSHKFEGIFHHFTVLNLQIGFIKLDLRTKPGFKRSSRFSNVFHQPGTRSPPSSPPALASSLNSWFEREPVGILSLARFPPQSPLNLVFARAIDGV